MWISTLNPIDPGVAPLRSSGTDTVVQEKPGADEHGASGSDARALGAPASPAVRSRAARPEVDVRLRICTRTLAAAFAATRHVAAIRSGAMAADRQIVDAPAAPPAIGPYSHAVRVGELLFCSGQIPLDPQSGEIAGASAAEQAERCLRNLDAVCSAAGTSLQRAVRVTIYMTDLAAFADVNEVYAAHFASEPPARVTVGVAQLPRGAYVEIDAIVATG
jgi:2-iminobutanoate/2-iminopropanoate deaminase